MQANEMKLEFDSRSCNESFARVAVAAFMTQLNPTLEEVSDVKTAVSEAVTNVIIHAYGGGEGKVMIRCRTEGQVLSVEVADTGCGIADVKKAMEPLFTTKMECDRAGMGFAFMEAFMDTLDVESCLGAGTVVRMKKQVGQALREGPSGYERRAGGRQPGKKNTDRDQMQIEMEKKSADRDQMQIEMEKKSADRDQIQIEMEKKSADRDQIQIEMEKKRADQYQDWPELAAKGMDRCRERTEVESRDKRREVETESGKV